MSAITFQISGIETPKFHKKIFDIIYPKTFEQARVCLDEAATERSWSKINLA